MIIRKRIATTDWRYLAIIFAAGTIICLPILIFGAPAGHSLGFNLVWLRDFSAQLFAGELYPRWLNNLNAGAGSPVFFFYAPLPFYVSSVGSAFCTACDIGVRLAIGEWILLTASGLSFYIFARKNAVPSAATIGAAVYILLPYHFEYTLWIRQSIGELGAYVWMPLILLYIQKISLREPGIVGLAVCYALLISTHLPAALLFSMFMLAYAVILSPPDKFLVVLPRFVAGVIIGALLSSVYLLPALLNLEHVASERLWSDYYLYDRWFFLDGQEDPGPITNTLYPSLLVTTAIFVACWFVAHEPATRARGRWLWPWIAFVVLAWCLMTPVSTPLWELIPVLKSVQFPWRVAIALDIAVAITVVKAIESYTSTRRLSETLALGCAALLFAYGAFGSVRSIIDLKLLEPMHTADQVRRLQYRISWRVDAQEYFPRSVMRTPRQAREMAALMSDVSFVSPGGAIDMVLWAPRRIEMDVAFTGRAYITVRQFYFPGWRARIIDGHDTGTPNVEPTSRNGFVGIRAPPGQYRLILELTRRWPEILGISVSAAAALLLLLIGFFESSKTQAQTTSSNN